ncbi:PqqA peptide cyclase [Candidatus Magnetaquicoccaceae bacterium FCR-1]|uniref:PqqA peptide cyclase n=1 Tax=Candidatus Magnetaquiglobus chichijimensis TaxID=3141448 RepID=A0ABQ0C908_9PROT
MFRLTQFMRRLFAPGQQPRPRLPVEGGPVIVWNLLRRCNLTCAHCYAASADRPYSGELSFAECVRVLEDLRANGVSALILSGGEPLLRPDLFEIAAMAKGLGFYLGLSSNGTLMDPAMAKRIAGAGFDYVGVSLDGLEANHDRMRGMVGAFRRSVDGIGHCRAEGVKAGIRFTPTRDNIDDLPGLFELMRAEGTDRFYLSHWNHAGRGKVNREENAELRATRALMARLFDMTYADVRSGAAREIVTGNNDADGVFFLFWVRENRPDLAERAEAMLTRWGGNASGVGIANIDELGEVHPDIFWRHHSLGNVRDTSFGAIWGNPDDPLLAGLRARPRPLKGRCGACRYLAICGGNTRVRACQVSGDPWEEDPGCYLTDAEVLP